jgi:hypothetical protein
MYGGMYRFMPATELEVAKEEMEGRDEREVEAEELRTEDWPYFCTEGLRLTGGASYRVSGRSSWSRALREPPSPFLH